MHVQVAKKTVDPEGLRFATLRPGNEPVIELVADSDLDLGTNTIEYQYKIDNGFWHPYQNSRFITVQDPWMRVQGRHVIHVRSRVVGQPDTVDSVPTQIETVIDVDPPRIALKQGKDGQVGVTVKDRVTLDPMVRYRLDDKAWSNWTPASRLATIPVNDAYQVSVEAQDNDGNIGTAQQALVRGQVRRRRLLGLRLPHGRRRRGPARSTSSSSSPSRSVAARPRASAAASQANPALPLPFGARLHRAARHHRGAQGAHGRGARARGRVVGRLLVQQGTAGVRDRDDRRRRGRLLPELHRAEPGAHRRVLVGGGRGQRDIWVSGYSEADYDNGNSYGDLVVGKYDTTAMKVDHRKQVDGVPSTPAVDCTMYDCNGFRGGQTASGDDVGIWSSIAIGGDNNPAVAYFDRTNQALKFAQYDGRSWSVQTVDSVTNGAAGRYSKMLFLNGNSRHRLPDRRPRRHERRAHLHGARRHQRRRHPHLRHLDDGGRRHRQHHPLPRPVPCTSTRGVPPAPPSSARPRSTRSCATPAAPPAPPA